MPSGVRGAEGAGWSGGPAMISPAGERVEAHPLHALLLPGQRLGWQYERAEPRPFPDQRPALPPPRQADFDARAAHARAVRRGLWIGARGLGVAILLACLGWAASGASSTAEFGAALLRLAGALGAGTLLLLGLIVTGYRYAVARAAKPTCLGWFAYRWTLHKWERDAAAFTAAEQDRLSALPRWRAAGPERHELRLDVFGGSHWGWAGLLTVTGAGYLAQHGPSLVVDLTGQAVAQDLRDLCVAGGYPVDVQQAPEDCDLLDGLAGPDLAGVIVEAVHGDNSALRTERATDQRILTAIIGALGDTVTLPRIADAIQVLLHAPGAGTHLTTTEHTMVLDELFADDTRTHLLGALARLDAYLHPLHRMTGVPRPARAAVTIVATPDTSAYADLIHDLILVWLTHRITTDPAHCRTLVLAGADHLPERHLERLADVCSRRSVRLIVLWRHLRDTGQRALGAGTTAFMRLGSAEEAQRAADFIGRQHRFVLSSLTRTTGGSHTRTESIGYSESTSTGTSHGSTLSGTMHTLLDTAQAWSRADQTSRGQTTATNTGTSTADTTTWSDTEAVQRVYEYAIEPTVLQGLPEYALLLARHTATGTTVLALDCNPAIVTLPGVEMDPQPADPPSSTDGNETLPWTTGRAAIDHTPPPAFPPATPHVPVQWVEDPPASQQPRQHPLGGQP